MALYRIKQKKCFELRFAVYGTLCSLSNPTYRKRTRKDFWLWIITL